MSGNSLYFNQLSSEQARQLVDAQQIYDALRDADAALLRQFAGGMHWRSVKGTEYLYRIKGKVEKSLGARSAETEAIAAAFTDGRQRAREMQDGLRERLAGMAPVNIALGLNRVPDLVGRVVRRLDSLGLLGERVVIVGTNALFAYEARAGVQIQSGLLATGDVDFALDARRSLILASDMEPQSLVGLLRQVDPTFKPHRDGDFRAYNARGFMVDLITSAPRDPMRRQKNQRLSAAGEDLEAAEIGKLQWLIEAPRFSAISIAENGLPVRMVAPDPRFFAAHKLWLSGREDREGPKRVRDKEQAMAVAALLAGHFSNLRMDDQALSQLPPSIRAGLRDAVASTPRPASPTW